MSEENEPKKPTLDEYRALATTHGKTLNQIIRLKAKLKPLEAALDDIESQIIHSLKAGESIRVRGMNYTRSSRTIAEIFDRDAYLAFASRPSNRDMLHKRISMEAAQERWDEARRKAESRGLGLLEVARCVAAAIPGVRPGQLPTLSVSKARAGR